jgi:hypothetical protein
MTILTHDQILQANDIVTETVSVPEWGGEVLVRGLSGSERDAFEDATLEQVGKSRKVNLANVRARLCALSIVDENGKRMFSDGEVRALGRKSAAALDRVFSVAQRLSGLTDEDVEELAKNSNGGQSEDSGSD